MTAAQGSTTAGRLRRRTRARPRRLRLAVAVAALPAIAVAVGFAFAGSADRLATGTRIAGLDVGGMTTAHARTVLTRRAARLAGVPVTFVAAGRRWRISPRKLGITSDWRAAVEQARSRGDGFAFVRGYRRLGLRFSHAEVTPPARSYRAALVYEVGVLADAVDRPARDAKLVRRGLRIQIADAQTGTELDRQATARVLVRALASFDRKPVALPVETLRPQVTAADLTAVAQRDRRFVSAPVTLTSAGQRRHLSRWQLASMLVLQQGEHAKVQLGGRAATRYFERLDREIGRPAQDASFALSGGQVHVVPSKPGLAVDVHRTAAALVHAAERRAGRVAPISVTEAQPQRSTSEAKAMGITGVVGSYETIYGGIANRIHNVQLVAHLVDDKLIAPGKTFSFNAATGERTAAKGFLEAPVIINGELQTALGGGVCQVSTTVFNAAYEAGLPITARTNHALYISHYPLGRDATVNYPDTDLKFVNDTPHWLWLRTFVGSSSLVVALYGAPQHRRVVSDTAPLRFVAPAPIERTPDETVAPGKTVVADWGVPAQATSVRRRVYSANGKLLDDTTWYSHYQAEPRVILVGPKPKPKPKPKKPKATVAIAPIPLGKPQP